MVSVNDTSKSKGEAEGQPPAYGGEQDKNNSIRDGLYILTNKAARTVLDLCDSTSNTQCHGWSQNRCEYIRNQLWIVRKSDSSDTYTLKSFRHSLFLDLWAGKPDDGARVVGYRLVERSLNQQWRLEEQGPNYFAVQSAKTNTYLEIPGGNSTNGTKTTCSSAPSGRDERDHQLWILDRVSRTGQEIRALIEQWKLDLLSRLLLPHGDVAEYLVLPGVLRRSIWEQTNLQRQPVRSYLFDYDTFVVKSKEAVHSWAKDAFPIETRGFGILYGIIYGEARKGPKAYNWYMTDDMHSLVFFDPQTGKEYTAATLNEFGFEPIFATF